MHLTAHGHACLTLTHARTRLTLDPGTLADTRTALADATGVLVTHEHPDHVDVPALAARVVEVEDLEVWGPAGVVRALAENVPDDAARRLHVAAPGVELAVGDVAVVVGGGEHARIHRDIPTVENLTYLLSARGRTVYHPGDSLEMAPAPSDGSRERLDVLLAPVSGPWLALGDTIDLVRRTDPHTVVPIHGELLSDVGHALVDRLLGAGRTGGTYDYRPLAAGETLELP